MVKVVVSVDVVIGVSGVATVSVEAVIACVVGEIAPVVDCSVVVTAMSQDIKTQLLLTRLRIFVANDMGRALVTLTL